MTSSNTVAGAVGPGAGIGPLAIDGVLGITKAYTTRVGGGPFPTELFDAVGTHLATKGQEFGATTGRPRRCGWLDAVMLRRAIELNGVMGLCITKLDVLDGLDPLRICVGYRLNGEEVTVPPTAIAELAAVEPVYEDWPGWRGSTSGLTDMSALPGAARAYLDRIAALVGIPIAMISTGPERDQGIVLRHPFQD